MLDRRDLEAAWPADEPPSGFSERVVAELLAERRAKRRRAYAGAALAVAAAAAVLVLVLWPRADLGAGERVASTRTEVALGARAMAVLEPAARISWQASNVKQPAGDVFYRVEPGTPFVVETPAGVVTVTGTCFRVRVRPASEEDTMKRREGLKLGAAGVLGALAVVTVYEGKVKLSHAGQDVGLVAGESGRLDGSGARKLEGAGELGDAEAALALTPEDRKEYAAANDELARDISDLNRRLRGVEKQKAELEQKLQTAREKLAAVADGAAPRTRHEFDLTEEDWSELAKDGTVKFRVPCFRSGGWSPSPETLNELGLAPDDGSAISDAYQKSNSRLWATIRPLCLRAIGKEDVVDTLGPDTCLHVVVDMARKQDSAAASEAMRQVGEIRAGLRPAPAPGTPMHPVLEIFLALTGEQPRFQADLAESLGPDEARRLAFGDGMCTSTSTFGGPGPRKP